MSIVVEYSPPAITGSSSLGPTGVSAAIGDWLENERERLPLLVPIALGCGISFWQMFGTGVAPVLLCACSGIAFVGLSGSAGSRLRRVLVLGALLVAVGFGVIAFKSAMFGAVPIDRTWVGTVTGQVQSVEHISARGLVRYRLNTGKAQGLPSIVRVNVDQSTAKPEYEPGAIIRMKVRLLPPPSPALPGGYDFARTAWFGGIGATGRAIGPVELVASTPASSDFWGQARNALAVRIERSMDAETGPVGVALLVGARGSIGEADAEALRNSGMAHLLSVSGLHVTAVVGGSYLLAASLFALLPWLALRVPVPLLAAALSALVAVGYTLLTGAEVPTIRACIAALLILIAMAMGREALSLRLLAAGAIFVLLFWPEALAGPSFQLSFAAVGTIILLHESKWVRRWTERREEALPMRFMRNFGGLLLTGIAIEFMLAPIALFHFHKSGLYGALANIAAIPLTTFVIMPAQLLGLFGDYVHAGLGAPFWWLANEGIRLILWIARTVSAAPGAVALLPEMPIWAFAMAAVSGLTVAILNDRRRWLMLVPLGVAIAAMLSAPRPDMLLTGDGQHLAIVSEHGQLGLLRPKAGDYARSILGETAAVNAEPVPLEGMPGAKCNPDICSFAMHRNGRGWQVLALRSGYLIPAMELSAACARVDIVISSRRLPWSCKPRWLKADAALLERTGGLAFYLNQQRVATVADDNAHHSWSAHSPERLARRDAQRAQQRAAKNLPPPQPVSQPIPQ